MKDWTGNTTSVFVCNGASNHSESERQSEDYYATEPKAIHKPCAVEKFTDTVWECACGGGHMVQALQGNDYRVYATDIIARGTISMRELDFFTAEHSDVDIITNPPYKCATEFVEHALEIVEAGRKVAMFLKLTFLEGKARRALFEKFPPKRIWVFSERVLCAKNGDFVKMREGGGSAVAYAWFVWQKGYQGETTVGWI